VKHDLTRKVTEKFFTNGKYVGHPDPWHDMLQWCETLLTEYLDPQVQRICLVDAPVVLGWKEIRSLDERYEGLVLRAVLRQAMNRGVIEKQPLRPLARLITAALFETCIAIATADDPAAARREAWPAFVRLLRGLRSES
jgi:hypothetical protein